MAKRRKAAVANSAFCWIDLAVAALTLAAVYFAYLPSKPNTYVYDDIGNFVHNDKYRSLSWDNLKWMATTDYTGPYQPLSWLSLAIDCQLGPDEPWTFRRTNILLHALTSFLLYLLIARLLARSWLGGAPDRVAKFAAAAAMWFYALHPLRVESVAWVTERRDVLSGALLVGTLLLWLRYVRQSTDSPAWYKSTAYWLAFGCFLLSMFAKVWGMTLPVVLLLLDIVPFARRDQAKAWLLEKVPFLAASGWFAWRALQGQKAWAMDMVADHTLVERIMQSLYGLSFYLGKTLWPTRLSPNYQLPMDFAPFSARFLIPALLTVGLVVFLALWRKREPALAIAWLCFAITVSPVLGMFQSGYQIAADRYTYIAIMPASFLLAAGLMRLPRQALYIAMVLSFGLIPLTRTQTLIWYDHMSLWNHVLALDPTNFSALNGRGADYHTQGKLDLAHADFCAAIAQNPAFSTPFENRAGIYIARKQWEPALVDVNHVLSLRPSAVKSLHYRGFIYQNTKQYDKAISDYDRVLQLQPRHAEARNNRGSVLLHLERVDEAITDFSVALEVRPAFPLARLNRGKGCLFLKRFEEAEADFNILLQRKLPSNQQLDVHWNLARIASHRHEWPTALEHLEIAIALYPTNKRLRADLEKTQRHVANP